MAQGKKSFVLYADLIHTVSKMPNDKAGELFKHILRYVNDEKPETEDLLIQLTFEPIKQQFKRDLTKWEETKEGRVKAGLASAEARKKAKELQQSSTNLTNVDFVQQSSTNPTVNDNVNVNVINKDNDRSVNWDALLLQFNSITGKKMRVVCDKSKRQINARLKEGYSKLDIVNAITNCFNDDFHKDNPHFLTLEFISRSEKMQKYAQDIKKVKPKQQDRL
jgi:hypothetical protein